jgi:hypothetical protein
MYALQMIKDYAPQMALLGVISWILFLVALRLLGAVFVDGGLLPSSTPTAPPLGDASEERTGPAPDDCIIVAGMKVCGSEESEGPLWK